MALNVTLAYSASLEVRLDVSVIELAKNIQ